MSLLNNVLKIAGTIVESAGKTILDCVEVIERENKEYKESDAYVKAQARRQEIKAEMKDNWNQFKENNKEYLSTYKRNSDKYNF